jgi:hypothetical protein
VGTEVGGGCETKKELEISASMYSTVRGAPSRLLEWGTVTHTIMRRADIRLLRSVSNITWNYEEADETSVTLTRIF